ncbi:hypothetical protein AYK24_06400 [Thermoplasmatales archaeon SG8-52-4]|nr:MAG: hypothetical protein AYK24_06400 [Thermoplasmatales archaeon SG8-52-4]
MKKEKKISLLSTLKTRWWLVKEQDEIKYKIVRDFTNACIYLPKPIRRTILAIIDYFIIIVSRFFIIINQLLSTAYIVSGKEKHSKKNLTILFIGDERLFPYLSSILFSKEPEIKKSFKIFIWNIKKKVNQNDLSIDAIFIKNDRFYSRYYEKQGYTIIPEWISTTLDISESLEKIYKKISKSVKEDIRKLKKYEYSYEISQDPSKLEMFYNKMYLPYISWKYGKFIKYANFYSIKHIFEQGGKILFIKLGNDYFFGGLFIKKKDKIYATYAGIMEGKFDCIKQGVIAGSYFYLISYAKKIGVKLVNFGSCRPFINDGLFSYKRKWGVKIEKTSSENADNYFFKVLNIDNKGIENFLKKNPFITLKNSKIITSAIKQENKN